MRVTVVFVVLTVFLFASSSGPAGWTGQPRWAQRFEMIVKLGRPLRVPLERRNVVRLETSPSAGSSKNVTTYHWPSPKASSGPMSMSFCACPTKGGMMAKPATGTVIEAPDERAEPERGGLEELRAREALDLGLVGERQSRAVADDRRSADRRRRAAFAGARRGRGTAHDVPGPEEAEDERDRGPDRRDDPADDDAG